MNTKIEVSVKDNKNEVREEIDMDELMKMVNEKYNNSEKYYDNNIDCYIALEIDYNLNFTVSDLKHILKYYDISIRKKKKVELIQDVVIFEMDPENIEIVSRRKYLWDCVQNIRNDKYLSKFLNITT